jgi:ankyrin repeat protein
MFRMKKAHNKKYAVQQCGELFEAVSAGDVDRVKQFLAGGIHPDVRDSNGHTPLLMAVARNHYSVACELLGNGADVDAASQSGLTALMVACACGYKEMVSLLLSFGASPNITNCDGRTALMFAASNGYTRIVVILIYLQPEIDIDMTDFSGKSALDIAVALGNDDVARLLVAEGAYRSSIKPSQFGRQENGACSSLIAAGNYN